MNSKEYYKEYYKKNKEKLNEYHKSYYKKNKKKIDKYYVDYALTKMYGISAQERDAMHIAQEGRCAICGVYKDMLCIDHNHTTGAVRGMLCRRCNGALGMMIDDVDVMYKMIEYINKYK